MKISEKLQLLWLSSSQQMEPGIKCLLPQINKVLWWEISHQRFRAPVWIDPERGTSTVADSEYLPFSSSLCAVAGWNRRRNVKLWSSISTENTWKRLQASQVSLASPFVFLRVCVYKSTPLEMRPSSHSVMVISPLCSAGQFDKLYTMLSLTSEASYRSLIHLWVALLSLSPPPHTHPGHPAAAVWNFSGSREAASYYSDACLRAFLCNLLKSSHSPLFSASLRLQAAASVLPCCGSCPQTAPDSRTSWSHRKQTAEKNKKKAESTTETEADARSTQLFFFLLAPQSRTRVPIFPNHLKSTSSSVSFFFFLLCVI